MTMHKHPNGPDTSSEFFERLYQGSGDPWNFRRSAYERSRYRSIIEGINDRSYVSIFEAGCSVGELTAQLAPYGQSVRAIDCSATAVEKARARCAKYAHVMISQSRLEDHTPAGAYDLIVFSEIGYYFSRDELALQIARLWSLLVPQGRLIACHWLGHSEDHRLHGAEVHETIRHTLCAQSDFNSLNEGYALQRWTRGNHE